MDEEETKLCTNCNREIPAVNFTTHSVHCARNIRPCPVCKEPVPVAQLAQHHDALHKEVPCKKCGESVCGTDLEDHIRDSCAQTIKPCRYCELELPRSALPAHEAYCGARSEQCADCCEYVMAKYRQLHLDSNHGFIRLDEDPAPTPKPNPKPNGMPSTGTSTCVLRRPVTEILRYDPADNRLAETRSSNGADKRLAEAGNSNRVTRDNRLAEDSNGYARDRIQVRSFNGGDNRAEARVLNGVRTPKRNNDLPQVNTSVQPIEKINKELPCRGAVKKRPAPPPPDARRDNAYASAARRAQQEERHRQEQTAYNLSVGLPPVLSPAAKIDKLRKLDALHNRELDMQDYKNCLQGRVWQPPEVPTGHVLGSGAPRERRATGPPVSGVEDLRNLQPMTPAQFMNRFQELQLGAERDARAARGDRFDEIKSSLRELRRGLNEVTAPYNSPPIASNADIPAPADGELRLPCEFCGEPVLADELVLHQVCVRDSERCAADEPRLLCEFCGEPVLADELVLHQVCVKDSERCAADEPRLLCEFCGEPVLADELVLHQVCLRASEWCAADELRLPCEFCGEPVLADELVLHQVCVRESERCAADEPRLLCEFCGEPVLADEMVLHQVCVKDSERCAADEPRLLCEFCGEPVLADELVLHQVCLRASEWCAADELRLPCEFCGEPVLADELVLHQTGCRPDLARLQPARAARRLARGARRAALGEPVIPCEFCAEALPVYLISDHQERCRREANILYPD